MGAMQTLTMVTRATRLEGLRRRWGTLGQAKFLLKQAHVQEAALRATTKQTHAVDEQAQFDDYEAEDEVYTDVIKQLERELGKMLPVEVIDRSFLPNYDFRWCAAVIVVGQDGLVANTAKYVGDLPLIGVNPEPARFDGVLLPFKLNQACHAVQRVLQQKYKAREVTLAEATLNDGQRMLAFNDLFVGANSHISARYTLELGGRLEPQSSSGVLISTGAGSTGWLSSIFNMMRGVSRFVGEDSGTPPTMKWEDRRLAWAVREPFVSRQSQADLVAGWVEQEEELVIESLMPQGGVIFSDGIESDFLQFNSGTIARIRVSPQRAKLVV